MESISNTTKTLPALQGSEKQIAWAEKIRLEAIQTLKSDFESPVYLKLISKKNPLIADAIKAAQGRGASFTVASYNEMRGSVLEPAMIEFAASQLSAAWWINVKQEGSLVRLFGEYVAPLVANHFNNL